MPTRDPKTGKPLSGAELRRQRKARQAQASAGASGAPAAASEASEERSPRPSLADFADLPPPPLGQPAQAISWANDVALIALGQVLREPTLTNPERWRWIKDLLAVVGMVRDKAAEQTRLNKLAEKSGLLKNTAKPKEAKPVADIPKPPTARRA